MSQKVNDGSLCLEMVWVGRVEVVGPPTTETALCEWLRRMATVTVGDHRWNSPLSQFFFLLLALQTAPQTLITSNHSCFLTKAMRE